MSILFDKELLVVNPKLAAMIGLNEAIILQQIHYWLKKSGKSIGGKDWIYNSIAAWKEQFPFFSDSTIKRTIATLEKVGIIVTGNFNKDNRDRTKWYSINYGVLKEIENREVESVDNALGQNDQCKVSNCTDSLGQNDQTITRDYTETTDNTPCSPPEGDQPQIEGKKKESQSITLKTFLQQCEAKGEYAIPPDDPIFAYAEKAAIPMEFVALQWSWFKDKYLGGSQKQKDWRQKFGNAVRGRWGRLWWFNPDGECQLTSDGIQFKNSLREEVAEC